MGWDDIVDFDHCKKVLILTFKLFLKRRSIDKIAKLLLVTYFRQT